MGQGISLKSERNNPSFNILQHTQSIDPCKSSLSSTMSRDIVELRDDYRGQLCVPQYKVNVKSTCDI